MHYYVNKLRQNVGLETWTWRQIVTSQTAHTKYKWPPYDPEPNPPMKIFCVRHCLCVCGSGSHTFLHVDPQLKYTFFCRPRGLAHQLLIQGICSPPYCVAYYCTTTASKGVRKGGLGLKPPWAWYFTTTLLPAQRKSIAFSYFLLVTFST